MEWFTRRTGRQRNENSAARSGFKNGINSEPYIKEELIVILKGRIVILERWNWKSILQQIQLLFYRCRN
jgi:hypothetical protein